MNATTSARRRKLALRAFPPRWRERHGDELLHVTETLSPSGEAGWRELADLVRGGLRVRIEDRPPWRVRAAYHWLERPVPPRWHPWMRDDLRGRLLGFRRNLRVQLPLGLVFFVNVVVSPPSSGPFVLLCVLAVVGVSLLSGPRNGRRTRRRMNAKVGYDIVAAVVLPPPEPVRAPVVIPPAPRMPYAAHAMPVSFWSLIVGTSLVAGAGISNEPGRSLGPVRYAPDPNSPLTTQQVVAIGFCVVLAAVALAVATAFVTRRRVRALAAATAHPTVGVGTRTLWSVTTFVGVPATLVGASGLLPDLACASIGALLFIGGTVSGAAALVVARADTELGRPISLADLLVGERSAPASAGRSAAIADH